MRADWVPCPKCGQQSFLVVCSGVYLPCSERRVVYYLAWRCCVHGVIDRFQELYSTHDEACKALSVMRLLVRV